MNLLCLSEIMKSSDNSWFLGEKKLMNSFTFSKQNLVTSRNHNPKETQSYFCRFCSVSMLSLASDFILLVSFSFLFFRFQQSGFFFMRSSASSLARCEYCSRFSSVSSFHFSPSSRLIAL